MLETSCTCAPQGVGGISPERRDFHIQRRRDQTLPSEGDSGFTFSSALTCLSWPERRFFP